jgi:hypothetical protein
VEAEQGRQQHALRQVAGGAEDHEQVGGREAHRRVQVLLVTLP